MLTAAKIGLASLMMVFGAANTSTTVTYPDPDIFSGVLQPIKAEASTRQSSLTEEQVIALVKKYAQPLHVNQKSMLETIRCEAKKNEDGTYDPLGQSEVLRPDGTQEKSFGLVQIYLPDHPEITKAQAQDPDFAISFMASEFSAGHASAWSCWKLLKKNGRI